MPVACRTYWRPESIREFSAVAVWESGSRSGRFFPGFFLKQLALHTGAFEYDRCGIPVGFEVVRPAAVGSLGVPRHHVMAASDARNCFAGTFHRWDVPVNNSGIRSQGSTARDLLSAILNPQSSICNPRQAIIMTSGLARIFRPFVIGSSPKSWSRFIGGLS
jgi:hypothetical protein